MPGLVPGIHVFTSQPKLKTWMAGTIGERSDAVLRTAVSGHDGAR
jgi:hypothetical protein